MISRRLFSLTCAICTAAGFVATRVEAQAPAAAPGGAAPAGGPQRKTLSTIDYPGDGKVSILQTLEAPAGTVIPKHTHPGIESSVVMEGEVELDVAGQASKVFKAGDGFQIPPGVVHGGKTLTRTKLAITYVVEKDKPLASPA